MRRPFIGIVADAKEITGQAFHAVGEKYIDAIAHGSEAWPLLIPAVGAGLELEPLAEQADLKDLVERLDGLFLPGSPSNLEPHLYGGTEAVGPHDLQRDSITLPLIRAALDVGLPLLGICRGFQEINVALGGTLYPRVHEVTGMMDHREDKSLPRTQQYAPAHTIRLTPGGVLAELTGADEALVNSLHGQGVDRLGAGLRVEAIAPDGLVEAVSLRNARNFAIGVQWHAEWKFREQPLSVALFGAFGNAARGRAAARLRWPARAA